MNVASLVLSAVWVTAAGARSGPVLVDAPDETVETVEVDAPAATEGSDHARSPGSTPGAAPPSASGADGRGEATPRAVSRDETSAAAPASEERRREAGPTVDPEHRRNYATVVAGDVAVGLGIGAFIAMVSGFAVWQEGERTVERQARREDPDPDAINRATRATEVGRGLAIGGAVSTGALLTAGITMIAVGTRREAKRRARAERAETSTLIAPVPGGLFGGVVVRF